MKMRMLTSNSASENNHMSRRSFLATAGGTFLAGHVLRSTADSNLAPIDIGTQKQLFIDEKFIQSKRNVTLSLTPPDLQRENLLVADRPWESGRVCSTGSVVQHQIAEFWNLLSNRILQAAQEQQNRSEQVAVVFYHLIVVGL